MLISLEGGRCSFQVDGELEKPNAVDRDGLWPLPGGSDLDMRHRLPGLSVGLAASLRSMPTAAFEVFQDHIHANG